MTTPTDYPVLIFPFCTIARVRDGDTVEVDLDFGFRLYAKKIPIRIRGVNCPEIRTEEGMEAAKFTEAFLAQQQTWTLYSYGPDAFGRWLGDFLAKDGLFLSDILLRDGKAKPYRR